MFRHTSKKEGLVWWGGGERGRGGDGGSGWVGGWPGPGRPRSRLKDVLFLESYIFSGVRVGGREVLNPSTKVQLSNPEWSTNTRLPSVKSLLLICI